MPRPGDTSILQGDYFGKGELASGRECNRYYARPVVWDKPPFTSPSDSLKPYPTGEPYCCYNEDACLPGQSVLPPSLAAIRCCAPGAHAERLAGG